jgi:hypothetical protein
LPGAYSRVPGCLQSAALSRKNEKREKTMDDGGADGAGREDRRQDDRGELAPGKFFQ